MIGPYFNTKAHRYIEDYTYTDGDKKMVNNVEYEWAHPFSEFVMSAINNGLRITSVKEYLYSSYEMFPNMKKINGGLWILEGSDLPLTFSMKCVKE